MFFSNKVDLSQVTSVVILGKDYVESKRAPISENHKYVHCKYDKVFHGFGQAKFAYGCLVLGSSQLSLLPLLPQKTILDS